MSLRILLAGQDDRAADRLLRELTDGAVACESRRVGSSAELADALRDAAPWDLVLLGHGAAELPAQPAIAQIRSHAAELPVVLVAGRIGEAAVADALRAGANDYLSSDRLAELSAVMHRCLDATAQQRHPRAGDAEAQESDSVAEGLLDSAPDAMLVVSGGTIVRANLQATALFGYERTELVGQPIEVLVPASIRAHHPQNTASYAAAPTVRHFGSVAKLRAAHRDGHEFPVEISLSPLPTPEGMLVVASIRDITARMEAEESLRLAEERFRGAFDQAPIGMALVATDGRFVRVNHALCELVGFSESQLLERDFADITHADDLDADQRYVERMLSGEIRTYQMQKRYIHASGDAIWVNLSVSLVRDNQDRPLHFIAQIQDISERRDLEAQLRHLADHDPLTGLLNRRGLEAAVSLAISRLARNGGSGALIVVDLDHFKSVNDTLGHGAGDELIIAAADLLKDRLRARDTVARLGGDEFAVVLPEASPAAATRVAETIVTAIRQQSLCLAGQPHQRITASVGVAILAPGIVNVEDALVAADLAMYDAKEAGRDRVAVNHSDGQGPNQTGSRLAWIQRIRAAIEEDRFTFHLQPILDLHTNEIRQHELLLRMLDEQGELVPPGAFLSVAERYGLIGEIDRWVAHQAILLIAEYEARGERLVLEVNLSGKTLSDPLMLPAIEQQLESTGIAPGSLIFEVTETAAVANMHVAREFANKLSTLGCRFALDDFGAGFGSFYYLKHLPADYLKIDGEFITRCIANRTDRHVIKALVGIAQGLQKQTIAECVEDQATLDFLRLNGVDFAQGYHIGRPVPIGEYRPSLLVP